MSGRMRGLLEQLLARRRETTGEGVSDWELLQRFTRDKDEAAFELLVWRHGSMVLGLCQRALRDEQLAEDAFQAVFLVLARKAGAIRGNLGGWLFKVARRVAVRALRNRSAVQPVVEIAAETPRNATEHAELTAVLDAEIARLPERLRRPVVLCYLGGHSTEDAARELGCPRGTVLSRLATARKYLAERLTRRGIALPATLAVTGLSAALVSSTLASAHSFRMGSFTTSTATQLAIGVLQTMKRITLVTVMVGLVAATTLAMGIGWAQQEPTKEGKQPAGAGTAPANPVANSPQPTQPAKNPAQQSVDDQIKKLEQLEESLRVEIEAVEKQIELLGRANQTTGGEDNAKRLAMLQRRHNDTDAEYNQTKRELVKLEVEQSVLKKLLDDKTAFFQFDPVLVQEIANSDPLLKKASAEVTQAENFLMAVLQKTENMELPLIKELKAGLAKAEKRVEEAREKATANAEALLQERERRATRQRIAKLQTEILIKKEICEKLKEERDALKKLLDQSVSGGIDTERMRKSLEPQREMLGRIQQQLLVLRAQRNGITLPAASATDAKLDQILRELAALRKEVQELKEQKK